MRRTLVIVLKVAISAALVAFFMNRVGWEAFQNAFVSANLELWWVAVGLFVASNLLGAIQWRELLKIQSIHLPVRQVVGLYFVGVFFNNFLVSNIGGDAVRIYDLRRLTGKGPQGFAATFLDRFVGLFILIAFSIVAYLGSPELWSTGLWVPVAGMATVLAGVLCFGVSRRLSAWSLEISARILPDRAVTFLKDVRDAFILYRHAYGSMLRVAVFGAGVQLLRVAVYACVGYSLGQEVPFRNYVVFIPLIAIVAAVPISFGGIGVRENIGAVLFSRVGVAPATGLAMMFLGYLAGILASVAGGVLFAMRRVQPAKVTDRPSELSQQAES